MKSILKFYFSSYLMIAFLFLVGCKKSDLEGKTIKGSNNTIIKFGDSHTLHKDLKEISGLEYDKNGTFWGIGDSGNDPILFGIDEIGNPITEINLTNAENNDWEDLALDENDNLLIGNFGNNKNDRENLNIYWIPNFSELNSNSVSPMVIEFYFEDQASFPPSSSQQHFDTEAMISIDDFIYLFTKDRSDPFEGITNLYQLPMEEGTHEAKLLASFNTSIDEKEGAITSADLSPDGNQLVLLSEKKIFFFKNINTPDFFDSTVETFEIENDRKLEGIVFQSEQKLFLANEKKYGADQQIISLEIMD